ncbi:hypothetical protein ES703_41615 [subsurface metagenome]
MKKMNKKRFNLKEEYKKSWNYLKESKNFIYIIMAIFFVFVLIGFFIPAPDSLVKQILEFIEELLEKTQGMSHGELIKFIFLNNLQSSFYGMIFGVLLGIFPMIAAIANGYLLGFVASISVENGGFLILWRLLPHGIFELPAVFISLGLGLKFGMFIFQKRKLESFKEYFFNSLRTFLLIIIPLLIIAGIIEGSLMSVAG